MSTILSQLKPLKIGDLTAKLPIIQGGMGVGIRLSSLALLASFHRIEAKPSGERIE